MNRKDFIKKCSWGCLALEGLSTFIESCGTHNMHDGKIVSDELLLPISAFVSVKNGVTSFEKYAIVHNDNIQFPICVYRFSENNYSAVYMRCPHQGAELQVFGDKLQCPAHGSEFDQHGIVLSAPADENLRKFNVITDTEFIRISLKA